MIHSMTAFASRTGNIGAVSWVWEMRGVNARGLDLRLRVPEGLPGLEQAMRAALTSALARGSVTVNLRITREESAQPLAINVAYLDTVLKALDQIQDRAFALGVTLAQPTASDVLSQRGIMVTQQPDDDAGELVHALTADFALLLGDFVAMRKSEGQALREIVEGQLAQIAALVTAAEDAAAERAPQVKEALTKSIKRVLDEVAEIDEARIAQELAVLAVKSDVTEEIDRLKAHVAAARALLADDNPSGRKLDFLAQEFNREANTLCSKAQAVALTSIGLDLKSVIDQMREQIQNME